MKFTKMQGIGNDYVYVNCFEEKVEDPAALAKFVSDRHFGIGSDGLILIKPSKNADFTMDMYNADGSQGEMCGNGIRCVAKYVYDHGMTNMTELAIETDSGIKTVTLSVKNERVGLVTVDMGVPYLTSNRASLDLSQVPKEMLIHDQIWETLNVNGKDYPMICISVGNPHAVVFMEDIDSLDIEKLGPAFEKHERFPDRTNTEFVQVVDTRNIRMRVWERGSGETMACGTGATASAVAFALANYTAEDEVTVKLLGGSLTIHWERNRGHVLMTGSATEVFRGEIEI